MNVEFKLSQSCMPDLIIIGLLCLLVINPVFSAGINTPREALEELKNGNTRFVSGELINTDYKSQIDLTKDKQTPHTVILTCMDSRVPPEIIFDQGIGNIFVARNAGNIEDENILGSMEYGVKFAGSKLILVLGHTNCGAVTGAVKDVQAGNLTQLLLQIKPAMALIKPDPEQSSEEHLKYLIDKTARNNVSLTIRDILERSEIISELVESGQIEIKGAYYDLATGVVEFLD